jgi:anaerobic selenocysteine-containing dehydrogenase
VTLEQLRESPGGMRTNVSTRHRKYEQAGFRTPSRKIELFSEVFGAHGYPTLPQFVEPAISQRSRPELAERFPLILSCAKSLRFCETQHRQVASLRAAAPDPLVELHPDTAAARGIGAGDWVRIETPRGAVRARAKLNQSLDPQVVFGQHGWWQGCEELDLPDYPPYGPGSANLNLVLQQGPSDPVGGSSPLRASVCNVAPLG